MTNVDVIKYIVDNNIIKDIINNVGYAETENNKQDLEQDIYLMLLERTDDLIVRLYEKKELVFYLTRIITNNILSKTSPYYYKYKKNSLDYEGKEDY